MNSVLSISPELFIEWPRTLQIHLSQVQQQSLFPKLPGRILCSPCILLSLLPLSGAGFLGHRVWVLAVSNSISSLSSIPPGP